MEKGLTSQNRFSGQSLLTLLHAPVPPRGDKLLRDGSKRRRPLSHHRGVPAQPPPTRPFDARSAPYAQQPPSTACSYADGCRHWQRHITASQPVWNATGLPEWIQSLPSEGRHGLNARFNDRYDAENLWELLCSIAD
ncbi:hypothetical protein BDY21DRAFT_346200 [Lineolata rhizophorae]|uniref:Uncharacterized protein n=1 Tax=Lineolata rhizophorae TaxID=578093 RepID=A0A6A6P046_9PEZI|nr:hypothetical protein BDY21DRAFT_346200 [Lineolata rhizophorae]